MKILFFVISLFIVNLGYGQGYYWQSSKKRVHYKYLTVGLGSGSRMYFGDVQESGALWNKINLAHQMDLRYQWKKHVGFAIQAGGRKYRGYKTLSGTDSFQEMNGRLWEGQFVAQFNWLKWEDMLKRSFYGFSPLAKVNAYVGLGFGGSLYNASFNSQRTSIVDSVLVVSEFENSAAGVAFYIPIEIGFRYRFDPTWSINLEYQYHSYFTDKLDAVESSLNDNMSVTLVKLCYSIGQPKKKM
jgi:opacity protein-like surface antigen